MREAWDSGKTELHWLGGTPSSVTFLSVTLASSRGALRSLHAKNALMPLNKRIFYLVFFGAPLLVAAGAFLASLYFAGVEAGSHSVIPPQNQPTTSVISDRPVRLDSPRSTVPQVANVPSDPIESMAESSQETPTVEPQSLKEPPFYKPSNEDLERLNPEQLVIYKGILEDYLTFYAEWSKNTPDDVEAWNQKIQECNQQIRFMLGLEASNLINFR